MSTSLLEALLIGTIGLAIAVILFSISNKFHFGLYRKSLTYLAMGILAMGVGGGFISFYSSIGYEKNTIVKTHVEGSLGVAIGVTPPIRKVIFEVEHPEIEHTLTIKPTDPILQNSFEADIYLEIIDPDNKKILSAQQHFVPYAVSRSPYMKIKRWRHIDTTFVPEHIGQYTLQVVPVTVDIPGVEVWIMEPQKKDGQRAFTWR